MSQRSSDGKEGLAVVAAALAADVRQAASLARSAGFGGLQLDIQSGSMNILELSQSGRRELRSVLRAGGVELVGLRIDFGPKGMGPRADVEAELDRADRVMEAAAGLLAPLVCIDVGPLPAPIEENKLAPAISPEQAGAIIIDFQPIGRAAAEKTQSSGAPRPFDAAFASSVDAALAELGRRADRRGVTLALRSELAAMAALQRAMRAAACPWLGVDLDPAALLRDDWSRDEIFSRLGGMIRHVRGRDATLGADRRTQPAVIGQGSVEWEELFAALESSGWRGWITVDPMDLPNRRAAALEGAATLQSMAPRRA